MPLFRRALPPARRRRKSFGRFCTFWAPLALLFALRWSKTPKNFAPAAGWGAFSGARGYPLAVQLLPPGVGRSRTPRRQLLFHRLPQPLGRAAQVDGQERLEGVAELVRHDALLVVAQLGEMTRRLGSRIGRRPRRGGAGARRHGAFLSEGVLGTKKGSGKKAT